MKKKGTLKSSIGPFDSELSTANALQKQYLSVFKDKEEAEYDEDFFKKEEGCIADIDLTI